MSVSCSDESQKSNYDYVLDHDSISKWCLFKFSLINDEINETRTLLLFMSFK